MKFPFSCRTQRSGRLSAALQPPTFDKHLVRKIQLLYYDMVFSQSSSFYKNLQFYLKSNEQEKDQLSQNP